MQAGGKSSSVWGFGAGSQYNARSERLMDMYKDFTRGIITMDSFWEGTGEFVPVDFTHFKIGVVLNKNNEFAILTRFANDIVSPFHHRMPVLFHKEGEQRFLDGEFSTDLWLPDNLLTLRK